MARRKPSRRTPDPLGQPVRPRRPRRQVTQRQAAPDGNGSAAETVRRATRGTARVPAARMPMGQFLFDYLHRRGVRHSFGVPGDFALPTFAWLDKSPIKSITMCHEPGGGFAADAYSRSTASVWCA